MPLAGSTWVVQSPATQKRTDRQVYKLQRVRDLGKSVNCHSTEQNPHRRNSGAALAGDSTTPWRGLVASSVGNSTAPGESFFLLPWGLFSRTELVWVWDGAGTLFFPVPGLWSMSGRAVSVPWSRVPSLDR